MEMGNEEEATKGMPVAQAPADYPLVSGQSERRLRVYFYSACIPPISARLLTRSRI